MTNTNVPNVRRIDFDGAVNVRDLGGYRVSRGGEVRWGQVYRADGLQDLTDDDLERFESLGTRTVFDLRSDAERELRPNRVASIPWCVMTPVEDAGAAPVDRAALTDQRGAEMHLQGIYSNLVAYSGAMFATMFADMSQPLRGAVMFHCHAGKDRTGVAAALLLDVLGVPREWVLDDYELTTSLRRPEDQRESYERLIASGMGPAAAAGMFGAPRWVMARTLEQVDERGGTERYLLDSGGIDADEIGRLRRRLVRV